MFTYHENRVLLVENGTLTFPNKVSVRIEFIPNAALGDRVPGLTCLVGSKAHQTWDANTGRALAESDPPLPRAKADINLDDIEVRIIGRSLKASFECASREQLLGVLGALHLVAPVSLSLRFTDPVIPVVTSGHVGNAHFVWQVERTAVSVDAVTQSTRDSRCIEAIAQLPTLCDPQNRRLLAACIYLQKAMRLLSAGAGPSEFAGEAVVNMAKTLEAIFPGRQSHDAARAGLKGIGYGDADIEEKFIPALVLRSKLDAAHVRMATLNADEHRKLQIYMENAIVEFRSLLAKVIQALTDGKMRLTAYQDERKPGDEISKILDRIGEPSAASRRALYSKR
jgi:hypothetical protein